MRNSPRPSRKCERSYAFLATGGTDFELFRYKTIFNLIHYMMFVARFFIQREKSDMKKPLSGKPERGLFAWNE